MKRDEALDIDMARAWDEFRPDVTLKTMKCMHTRPWLARGVYTTDRDRFAGLSAKH